MKRALLYGALIALGTMGLSLTAAARDQGQHGQYHRIRHDDFNYRHHDHVKRVTYHRDRDDFRHESRQREHREWARRHHERRQWSSHHYQARHHNNGKHEGWERGRHNPHDGSFQQPGPPATQNGRPFRPGR